MATTPPFPLRLPLGDQTSLSPKPMASLSLQFSKFRLKPSSFTFSFSFSSHLRPFSSSSSPIPAHEIHSSVTPINPISPSKRTVLRGRGKVRVRIKASEAELKENWLASLSCPLPREFGNLNGGGGGGSDPTNVGSNWVIGIDPDLSGALAVLKGDDSDSPAQVFDSPHLPVLVGGKVRRRLDAKSIIQLLRSFDAPTGTTAYIEQSIPFPKDGKQGWWSGGFGYGLWIGILVSLGFSVVPVPSFSWKKKFELSGSTSTKDDSRRVASTLFPSLSSLLKRKKDHGRAEALLIAAYGRDLKMELDSSFTIEELVS